MNRDRLDERLGEKLEAGQRKRRRATRAEPRAFAGLRSVVFGGEAGDPGATNEIFKSGAPPLRLVNGYGLFAVMTTEGPEIRIEGSADGVRWQPYEFKWKPGDVNRRPRFVAPHQPRLDWQMWFAALGSYQDNPWVGQFLRRLLRISPDVVRLLKKNAFADKPPNFIRAVLYDYRFTDFAARRATGAWWRVERRGLYSPVLSLHGRQPGQKPSAADEENED